MRTDFENMTVAISPDLELGEGSDAAMHDLDLKRVLRKTVCDPESYEQLPWFEKVRLADMMISRWEKYRTSAYIENMRMDGHLVLKQAKAPL